MVVKQSYGKESGVGLLPEARAILGPGARGQGMQVDDREKLFKVISRCEFGVESLLVKLFPLTQSSQVVTQVRDSRGLNAGKGSP